MANVWDDLKRAAGDVGKGFSDATGGGSDSTMFWGGLRNGFQSSGEESSEKKELEELADKYYRTMMNTAKIQGRQQQLSAIFEEGKEGFRTNLKDSVQKPVRQQLSSNLEGNTVDASRRGLLGSGIKQRNDANAVSRYKSDFMQAGDAANRQTDNISDALRSAPINTGLQMQGMQQSAENDYYRNLLNQQNNDAAVMSGAGRAVGNASGMYTAKKEG